MKIWKTTDPLPTSSLDLYHIYNALDTCVTFEVYEVLLAQLDEVTSKVYEQSVALQGPILEMDLRGVLVDITARDDMLKELGKDIQFLEEALAEILEEGVGTSIKPSSPKQLAELLYDVLGLPEQKNIKSGTRSVDRKALDKLKGYFYATPIVNHILAIRDLSKQSSTLRTSIDGDNRIRTSFSIAGTDTGRFASYASASGTGTNMQNLSPRIRHILIADPGMRFAYIDLEQAESRAVGAIEWNLFHDGTYLDACESSDLHTVVAKMCWDKMPWTGDLKKDKALAKETLFYRDDDLRQGSKKMGHACLSSDHEVLTPEGWVSIDAKPEKIMCWSEHNGSYFDTVSNWTAEEYSGDMFHLAGNSISALVTPNHRIPYTPDYSRNSPVRERFPTQGRGSGFIPLGGGWIGGAEVAQARIIAAIMSDGYVTENGKRPFALFHLKKTRKIERIKRLAIENNIEFVEYNNPDETVKINLFGVWPKKAGAFMFNWDKPSIEAFLDEYKYWDGHIAKTAVSLSSTDRKQLEWIQLFGRICGIGGAIQKPQISGFGSICYTLQQNHRKWASCGSMLWKKTSYSGKIYCPTVKTGWFYIRREGKISVTGNSNYFGQPPEIAKQTGIPPELVKEFQPKYFRAFPSHQKWHQWVQSKLLKDGFITTYMGRRRTFFGRRWESSTIRAAIAYEPQSAIADYLSRGILNVWRDNRCQILLQIHDALLIQYPAELENEIVPAVQKMMEIEIPLLHGRSLIIPTEALVGWNWGYSTKDKNGNVLNPNGLIPFDGNDKRQRLAPKSILDRKFSQT